MAGVVGREAEKESLSDAVEACYMSQLWCYLQFNLSSYVWVRYLEVFIAVVIDVSLIRQAISWVSALIYQEI